MSKDLRHIHLSSGTVIAIMAADVVSLAREQIIYDCTDGHDLHIDPELEASVENVEQLLESVAKAHQVIWPTSAETRGVSGGVFGADVGGKIFGAGGVDWAREPAKMAGIFGGKVDDGVAHAKVADEAVISHKEHTSRLLREAIAGGIVAIAKANEETNRTLKDIEAAARVKIGQDEFNRLMTAAAVEEAAKHVAVKLSVHFKKSLGI